MGTISTYVNNYVLIGGFIIVIYDIIKSEEGHTFILQNLYSKTPMFYPKKMICKRKLFAENSSAVQKMSQKCI